MRPISSLAKAARDEFRQSPIKSGATLLSLALSFAGALIAAGFGLQALLAAKPVPSLDCSKPNAEDVLVYESDTEQRTLIAFPIRCLVHNPTDAPISIVAVGPATVSNGGHAATMIGRSNPVHPVVASTYDAIPVDIGLGFPKLVQAHEAIEFHSIFALPPVDITTVGSSECVEPTDQNLQDWGGKICASGVRHHLTNFLYLENGSPFWTWNRYGTLVVLADGSELVDAPDVFLHSADCGLTSSMDVPICESAR